MARTGCSLPALFLRCLTLHCLCLFLSLALSLTYSAPVDAPNDAVARVCLGIHTRATLVGVAIAIAVGNYFLLWPSTLEQRYALLLLNDGKISHPLSLRLLSLANEE